MQVILIVAAILFFCPWLVDLLGLVDYEIPLSQPRENIVRVEILDSSENPYRVISSLTGEEMDAFLQEYLQLRAGRYANDPPTSQGLHTVRLCYADGGYDELGNMVEHFSSNQEKLRIKGWYEVSGQEVNALLEKYLEND